MSDYEDWNCPYCNTTLPLKSKYTKSGHLSRCSAWKEWRDSTLTEEFLYAHYVQQGKAMSHIAQELGLSSVATINRKMKEFGIETRSISAAKKMPKARQRAKDTHLDKYGSPHNFCADHPSRHEWEARLLEEEGITNVFQRESVKEKIKQSYEERYGTRNLWTLDWYRSKIAQSMVFSSIHQQVYQYLSKIGIPCSVEFHLDKDGDKKAFFDIHVEGTTKLIEVHGDYWHANPEIYNADDVFNYPQESMTAQEKWDYDAERVTLANEAGFDVLVLWEKDINEDWEDCCDKLDEYIGVKDA
jgi:G:T-mismatch repair DNA endonuclease (very short patch repair protein)